MYTRKDESVAGRKLIMVTLVAIVLAAVVVTGAHAYFRSNTSTRAWQVSGGRAQTPSAAADQIQLPVPLITSYFTPTSLPVRIVAATANSDKGATQLNYTLSNSGGAEIGSFDLALFDFNATGGLVKVQGWNLQAKLATGQSANFSWRLKSPATAASRLLLTIEAVRANADLSKNTATHWQVNFTELAQTLAAITAGAQAISPQAAQRTAAIPELYGSSYCSDAFAKAFQLSKTSDGKPLNVFSCDRTERSVVFGFNGKSLLGK